MFARLSSWLDYTAFPRIEDIEGEARKVAALRIAAGLLLVWRCALMLRDSWYYFDPIPFAGDLWPLHALAAMAQLALAIGLVLGLAPAFCAVLLLATHPAYSIWTGTYNLAPMLLAPMLGAFAALETGRLTLIGQRRSVPAAAQYRAVSLILFTAFAGWNFQALLYHVRDAYWISGQTMAVLLVNSYLSEFYGMFRSWESATPDLFVRFSIVVVLLQSVFQLAMLPLMVTRWGARFVHLWGWVFILGSLADLQLSILPLVQSVMWAMVFTPARWFVWAGGLVSGSAAHSPAPARGRIVAIGSFCGVYGLLLLLYFGNALGQFTLERRLPGWVANPLLYYSGLVAPNVFNREDLTMGDRWPVIEQLDGGTLRLIPFTGPEGERLAYHRSDLLYFGNSLVWRRSMINAGDLTAYHQPGGGGYEFARRVALYDYRRQGATGPGRYRVRVFHNHAADHTLGPTPARYLPEPVCEFILQVGPGTP